MKSTVLSTVIVALVAVLTTGVASPTSAHEGDTRDVRLATYRLERTQSAAHELERASREAFREVRSLNGRHLTRHEEIATAELGDLVRSSDRLHRKLESTNGRANFDRLEGELAQVRYDRRNAARAVGRLHDHRLNKEIAHVNAAMERLDESYASLVQRRKATHHGWFADSNRHDHHDDDEDQGRDGRFVERTVGLLPDCH